MNTSDQTNITRRAQPTIHRTSSRPHTLVGFGFGPIQSGLFVKEARESGNFSDITVAEVDAALVDAIRGNGARYAVNVAHRDGIEVVHVDGVMLLNPRESEDRLKLEEKLRHASEIVTSLPSVASYSANNGHSVANFIARGLQSADCPGTIIYTAENNNQAAEILEHQVTTSPACANPGRPVQYLNTVIGKMSRVVTDLDRHGPNLAPITPGFSRAFLVEDFNHIQTAKVNLAGFTPGITVFEQNQELLPFEEAKLFGHNAIHTLLGFIAMNMGRTLMAQVNDLTEIMTFARDAFINETGRALMAKYSSHGDPLFTPAGYRHFADDLLARMVNPYLADTVERAMRDPIRKLGYNDRIFGSMRLCLSQGVPPRSLAVGAAAGLNLLIAESGKYSLPAGLKFNPAGPLDSQTVDALLTWLWKEHKPDQTELVSLVAEAQPVLQRLIKRC